MMQDEKLKTIMETFSGLNHNEQVDLFLAIKDGLLIQRKLRIETHQKDADFQNQNVQSLYAGNDVILGNNVATKA